MDLCQGLQNTKESYAWNRLVRMETDCHLVCPDASRTSRQGNRIIDTTKTINQTINH